MEKDTAKRLFVAAAIIAVLVAFFFIARGISPEQLKELGMQMPLPVFTFLIAIIDGFNPCTIWVLTFLLALLVSVSENRRRMLIIGLVFAAVIYVFYFTFMAAWLNLIFFIGFLTPIRIGIGILAIVAGAISCKEFFAFRKGVTLMIQEQHKKPLMERMEKMKNVIKYGSTPALIAASAALAAFASIVELPCTAGWPLIYTTILAEKVFETSAMYYIYLLFYNLIYIIPLLIIIVVFTYFFRGKKITKRQMQIIKLIGGIIMIALGIILLFNPELLMLM